MELTVSLPVIGMVRTSHQELETTPIQAGLSRAEHGTIEIAEAYQDGLDGLDGFDGFDYAWLLAWLHRPRNPEGDPPLRQVPFLLRREQRRMGIFATRNSPLSSGAVANQRAAGVHQRELLLRAPDRRMMAIDASAIAARPMAQSRVARKSPNAWEPYPTAMTGTVRPT
jgi:hypothetical protein